MPSLNSQKELAPDQLRICGSWGGARSCAFLGMRARMGSLGDRTRNEHGDLIADPTLVCCKPDQDLSDQISKRLLEGHITAKGDFCSGPPDFTRLKVVKTNA